MELSELPESYVEVLRRFNARKAQFGAANPKKAADVEQAERYYELLQDMKGDGIVREIVKLKQHGVFIGLTPHFTDEGLRLADELKQRDEV